VTAGFVFVHSLLLGPRTWAPVADRLAASGAATAVPSLTTVAEVDDPPFWPRVADQVGDAVARLPDELPVFLVAHSNAGLFIPVIVRRARRRVAGCVFVEARLPPREGVTAAATPGRLDSLRAMATDGRLPPWTTWWDDVTPLFGDAATMAAVEAEQPRLPFSYYEQQIPVPAGWDDRPCGYLLFGPPYDDMAREARGRGWDVEHIPGRHLHQLVDPGAVAARLTAMTDRWLR
jgi:hypothetical protein